MAAFLNDHDYRLFWITDGGLISYSSGEFHLAREDTFNVLAIPQGHAG
jgi:hypothetical protein